MRRNPSPAPFSSSRCPMARRQFLTSSCKACLGAAGLLTALDRTWADSADAPVTIRVIHSLHAKVQPGPDWPNVGFDFGPVMERMKQDLTQGCPGFRFLFSMANGEEQAKHIIEQDKGKGIDGYLVTQMNCWNKVVQTAAASSKPVLYADFQFGGSGGFLVYTAAFLRRGAPNVAYVASSNPEDLVESVKCFRTVKNGGSVQDFVAAVTQIRTQGTPALSDVPCKEDRVKVASPKECMERMKASKILAIGGGWPGIAPAIQKGMGIEVVNVPFEELNKAWEEADRDLSSEIADRWQKTAKRVVDVDRKTLETSAAMYLAEKSLLEKRGANAITINCLGGFYGGHIHAYPCLGFYELNSEGLIGACECDVRSTSTMVMINALTGGRPGYISDPVIDTSKRQIIYAHCVAHNKAFGPEGPTNPIEILTHSEDRQGACVRSFLPLGFMTTSMECGPERKQILLHRGRAVENVLDDRACRTKLAVEPVGDLEKLFTQWDQWGWHRVTAYGDLREAVFELAEALGWTVLEEC